MRVLQSIPIVLVLAACGSTLLGPEFPERLAHFGGCGDVVFFAVDDDDQVMVTFVAEGLVTEARNAGVETTTVVELPSEDVELRVEQGSRISDATCDDVIENTGPRVVRSWTAVSGTATVRIRPLDQVSGARGDLVLEDVVFRSGGADLVIVDDLEWTDVLVGWYSG